jgi:formate hydrogenlyase subunit 3/multisubunit Na+/H+ antiporter MnhD subunit
VNKSRLLKLAARAGIIAPLLLAVVVTGLTIIQAEFMRSIGWNPFGPVIDWPSGLALGPYGWLMTLAFFVCGGMMAIFAYGLRLALEEKFATTLLMIAGIAMMGLIFTTDLTLDPAPRT